MEAFSKLLTAIAAFIGAIAWPVALLTLLFTFRSELKQILVKVPNVLDRVRKATLAGIDLELNQVAAEVENTKDKSGKITPRQIEAAARIEIQSRDVDSRSLLSELDRLCLEYDSLRRSLPPGSERTRAMTRVLVRMRSLAPSVVDSIDAYKGSGSAGSRLAAIAMMQMVPVVADLDWLKERFSSEHPFVFYHAALALQNAANICDTPQKKRNLRQITEQALSTLKRFPGIPDRETIEILEMLLSSLPE